MKIAIPVKMNRENPPLAPLFGKAKWFALIEDGHVNIVENPAHGGRAVIEWLANEGVDTIIFQEMGLSPYKRIKEIGTIDLFHAGYDRIVLDDVLRQVEEETLPIIDDSNIDTIISHHESKHSHGEKH